jgi:hypothetical protein
MILIGVTGKAGSGKDTVGEILHQSHSFVTLSFAQPIKDMTCALLGVRTKKWEDRAWRETELPIYGCSPRHIAQTLGTEWGRFLIKDSLWLDLAIDKVKAKKHLQRWVITDVRFTNEATEIRKQGGTIIHVNRLTDTSPKAQKHASEAGIRVSKNDIVLDNGGTFLELVEKLNKVMVGLIAAEKLDTDEAKAARDQQDLKHAAANKSNKRGRGKK